MSPASGRARPQTPDGLECPQTPDGLECPQAPDGLIFSGWALIISAQPALVSGRAGVRAFRSPGVPESGRSRSTAVRRPLRLPSPGMVSGVVGLWVASSSFFNYSEVGLGGPRCPQ
ncbi:hypothetical protein C0Q59_14685 [Streptomyces albidoflavus]|nr:hypothetical protein C0Q59_14685 [Streptomyces albidoflavus]